MDALIAEFESSAGRISWESLDHARGSAEDTPRLLRALWAGGPDAAASYGHLWSDLLGGSRVWRATAPAAYLLSILVRDGKFGGDDKTLREGALVFFRELALRASGEVGQCSPVSSIAELEGPAPEPACSLVIPTLLEVELSLIDHPDLRLASCASTAAVAAVTTSQCSFQPERRMLVKSLTARACSTGPTADRAGALIDLGRMGQDLSEYLPDQDLAISLAAALGSTRSTDLRTLDVLLDAARRISQLDSLLSPPGDSSWMTLPQLGGRRLSIVVAEEVCKRVEDLDLLMQPLISATKMTGSPGGYLVARPYYRKFFVNGFPAMGEASRHQMEIVCIIAEADGYWSQPGWQRFLAGLRLPTSRESWRNYCQLQD